MPIQRLYDTVMDALRQLAAYGTGDASACLCVDDNRDVCEQSRAPERGCQSHPRTGHRPEHHAASAALSGQCRGACPGVVCAARARVLAAVPASQDAVRLLVDASKVCFGHPLLMVSVAYRRRAVTAAI